MSGGAANDRAPGERTCTTRWPSDDKEKGLAWDSSHSGNSTLHGTARPGKARPGTACGSTCQHSNTQPERHTVPVCGRNHRGTTMNSGQPRRSPCSMEPLYRRMLRRHEPRPAPPSRRLQPPTFARSPNSVGVASFSIRFSLLWILQVIGHWLWRGLHFKSGRHQRTAG